MGREEARQVVISTLTTTAGPTAQLRLLYHLVDDGALLLALHGLRLGPSRALRAFFWRHRRRRAFLLGRHALNIALRPCFGNWRPDCPEIAETGAARPDIRRCVTSEGTVG